MATPENNLNDQHTIERDDGSRTWAPPSLGDLSPLPTRADSNLGWKAWGSLGLAGISLAMSPLGGRVIDLAGGPLAIILETGDQEQGASSETTFLPAQTLPRNIVIETSPPTSEVPIIFTVPEPTVMPSTTLVESTTTLVPIVETVAPTTVAPEITLLPIVETVPEPIETLSPETTMPLVLEIPHEIVCDRPFYVPNNTGIHKIEKICAEQGIPVDLPDDFPLNAGQIFDVHNVPAYTPVQPEQRESGGGTCADAYDDYTTVTMKKTPWATVMSLGLSDGEVGILSTTGFFERSGLLGASQGDTVTLPTAQNIRCSYEEFKS